MPEALVGRLLHLPNHPSRETGGIFERFTWWRRRKKENNTRPGPAQWYPSEWFYSAGSQWQNKLVLIGGCPMTSGHVLFGGFPVTSGMPEEASDDFAVQSLSLGW